MPLLLGLLVLPLVLFALMPLILIQRYRAGASRRLARPWIATVNIVLMAFSTVGFLTGAAVVSVWFPDALIGAIAGLGAGLGLGIVGLVATRWERSASTLHYTPNRWLVLLVTFAVSARILYGFWRSWAVARAGFSGPPVVEAFGVPESLAAGGLVIGYYLAYGFGVRRCIAAWQRRKLRVM